MKSYKSLIALLIIFILASTGILATAYFDKNGSLSPDSADYLRLAQNLIDGHGYTVPAYYNIEKEKDFFALWPIGYPTMIFVVAKVCGLDVFWASKVVNIAFLGFCLGLLLLLFKESAYIYALFFLCGSMLSIFSHTWSEVPFIFGLLWLAFGTHSFWHTHKTVYLINIFLATVFLFLNRYIGIFAIGVPALLSLRYLRQNDMKNFWKLFACFNGDLAIVVLYLLHNYIETGYMTGMQRLSPGESIGELVVKYGKTVLCELNFIFRNQGDYKVLFTLTLFIQVAVAIYFARQIKQNHKRIFTDTRLNPIGKTLFFIGMLYVVFLIVLRCFNDFDCFTYRFFAPPFMLFYIVVVNHLEARYTQALFGKIRKVIIAFAIASFIINVPVDIYRTIWIAGGKTYGQTLDAVRKKYGALPEKSLVFFPDKHLKYIRPDIKVFSPDVYYYKHITLENFMDIISRVPNQHIYLEMSDKIRPETFHPSLREFIYQHKHEQFIRIR